MIGGVVLFWLVIVVASVVSLIQRRRRASTRLAEARVVNEHQPRRRDERWERSVEMLRALYRERVNAPSFRDQMRKFPATRSNDRVDVVVLPIPGDGIVRLG